jgi:hypothetical protein
VSLQLQVSLLVDYVVSLVLMLNLLFLGWCHLPLQLFSMYNWALQLGSATQLCNLALKTLNSLCEL